jgi:hypothetical protein
MIARCDRPVTAEQWDGDGCGALTHVGRRATNEAAGFVSMGEQL